jgi:hypothetical protein
MTPRLKEFLVRVPLYFGASTFLEVSQYQQIGIKYPYPAVSELWVLKHLLIALLISAAFRIETISRIGKKIAAYYGLSFVVTVLIHLDYPGVRFCGYWCGDLEPLAIPFIAIRCAIQTMIVLYFTGYVQKQATRYRRAYYLFIVSLPVYFVLRPVYLKHLDKTYPVTWLYDQSTPRGSATYLSVGNYQFDEVFPEFESLAKKIDKDQWKWHCFRYGFLSFNSHLFGKAHADSCYYYAALSYRDPTLCSKLYPGFKEDCKKDLERILAVESSKMGRVMQVAKMEPGLSLYEADFNHGPNDKPYIKVFNATSNAGAFKNFEIFGGVDSKSILKVDQVELRPGEIHKISLVKQKPILKELGWGPLFTNLEIKADGRSLERLHNPIFLPHYKKLCLKSWNLDPYSQEELFVEFFNFSNEIQNTERIDISPYGLFSHMIKTSTEVRPHLSVKVNLEAIRADLKGHIEKQRPSTILYKSLVITQYSQSISTLAAVEDIDKVVDFCSSPKD